MGAPGASAYAQFSQASPGSSTITYDALNRLTAINDTGGWSRGFQYDQWGNMSVTAATGMTPLNNNTPQQPPSAIYNANNQRTDAGLGYDAKGNVNAMNQFSGITYDAENRLLTASSPSPFSYQYDGEGRRVTKTGAGNTTVYVYDVSGQLAAEYNSKAQPAPACMTCYLSYDYLGSVRMVTSGPTGTVVSRHDFLPFGEEVTTAVRPSGLGFTGSDYVSQRFTGKERDSESGLDYFGARYYGSALGRWTSPDTINLTDERILSPTNTLNKYVYGANNPFKFLDPDGRDVIAFYDHGGIAGHSMVLAYNQDTGDYAVKDYGPAHGNGGDNGDRLIELAGGKISGVDDYYVRNVSSPQDLRDNYSSLTIQTSPETAQEVINAIRSSYGNEPKEFNAVYGPNCSSSCSTVLKALGIGKDQTPAGLWGDLFRRYAKNRNSSHGFNYVFGSFYPHQNNTEYGNPRYSVDSFDLLFKLLFPSKGCVTVSDSASKSTFGGCN